LLIRRQEEDISTAVDRLKAEVGDILKEVKSPGEVAEEPNDDTDVTI
jgi:hypothetical protein